MGPRNDQSKAVASILAYATRLQSILSDISSDAGKTGPAFSSSSVEELKKYILDILPISYPAAVGGIFSAELGKLDVQGTALWNACTRLMRVERVVDGDEEEGAKEEKEKEKERERQSVFLCYVKTFAFLLLESGSGAKKGAVESDIRILKVALKTAKACIEFQLLDIALKVLQCAAAREQNLSRAGEDYCQGRDELACKLSTEYYSLRVALAWRQNRLDLAEHMFSKISPSYLERSPSTAESVADLFYEIGSSILGTGQEPLATRWIKRSYDALSLHGLEKYSQDAGELRLCVLHALARVNLVLEGKKEMGTDFFDILQRDYGDKLPAMLLKLEVIGKQLNPNYCDYSSCLFAMMKTAKLTDVNFKMILHHIHRLKTWSIESAAESLQYLLVQRLSSHGNDDWNERSLVTFIWMVTTSPTVDSGLERIKSTVEKLTASWRNQLSAAATHAALILIWKKVDAAFGTKDFAVAIEWCKLAQCSIFENAGATNKAKIQRKLILCGLGNSDTTLARGAFAQLPDASRPDPLTWFLMYKVALKDRDLDLGKECLEALYNLETDGTTYMLACVVEAQQSNNKHQAAIVLQRLLDKLDYSPAEGIHLPALLRCTIRLLILEVDTERRTSPDVCEQICTLFECAAAQAGKRGILSKTRLFTTLELEWFSRNSYNLALMSCTTWDQGYILRLLNACIKTIDQYPADLGEEALSDITLRRMFCDFLGAVITISQARTGDTREVQQERYLDVQVHVQGFRGRLQSQRGRCDPESWEDLVKKYRILLSFEFEAVARLQQWAGLKTIVYESTDVADAKLHGVFADVILCSEAPVEEMVDFFKIIIHSITHQNKPNTPKLSRWIRCLFQLALDSNVKVAEDVLDQAYALARDHQSTSSSSPSSTYPEEELEWLATTAFNRGVDFYLESADAESQRWVEKALDLATVMRDGGLKRVLKSKAGELEWDDEWES